MMDRKGIKGEKWLRYRVCVGLGEENKNDWLSVR